MKIYDVMFEDEDGNCHILKEEVSINVAKQCANAFANNLPKGKEDLRHRISIVPVKQPSRPALAVHQPGQPIQNAIRPDFPDGDAIDF